MLKKIALGLCIGLSTAALHAATLASDNAAATPYQDGWASGDNGGIGFQAWNLSSTGNGGRYIGTTGQGASPSFGIFSPSTGDLSLADRNFNGVLSAGQSFNFVLGVTGVAAGGGVVGMNLFDGTNPAFTLKFTGGGTFWQLNDGGTDFDTNIPFAASTPLSVSFTYNGGNSYNILLTQGATSYVGNGYTATSNLTNLTGFRFFSSQQGNGENLGFNDLAVVPEPATLSLIAGPAVLGLLALARRRRS